MSKQEILIVSEDTDFVLRFIKFLESQPKQEEPKTCITFLEEGTKQLLDKVIDGANELVEIRRNRKKEMLSTITKSKR